MFLFKNDERGILSSLKLWVCSGEPLPVSLAKQFLNTFSGHTLCNFYGSTEIMGDVSYYAIKTFSDLCFGDKIPIGKYEYNATAPAPVGTPHNNGSCTMTQHNFNTRHVKRTLKRTIKYK